MGVKHNVDYGLQTFDLVVGAIIAWIMTHLLDAIAKRIRASINASDSKSLAKLGYFCMHIVASLLEINPAEEESCVQRNRKLHGIRGGFYVLEEFMEFSLLT